MIKKTTAIFLALLFLYVSVSAGEKTIKTFSGGGAKNTRPFNVSTEWEIQWDAKGMIFQIFLFNANGDMVGVPANQQGPGKGSSYQSTPGKYYLQINAMGDWKIKIVELTQKSQAEHEQPTEGAGLDELKKAYIKYIERLHKVNKVMTSMFMIHNIYIEAKDVASIQKACGLSSLKDAKAKFSKMREELLDLAKKLGLEDQERDMRRYLIKKPDCIYPVAEGLWSRIDNFCTNIKSSEDIWLASGVYRKKFSTYWVDALMNKDTCIKKINEYNP